MRHWKNDIERADSLDALRDILEEAGRQRVDLNPGALDPDRRVDRASLPTFGGREPPPGTVPIWSWDEERLLVGDDLAGLRIVTRVEWREWMRKERE